MAKAKSVDEKIKAEQEKYEMKMGRIEQEEKERLDTVKKKIKNTSRQKKEELKSEYDEKMKQLLADKEQNEIRLKDLRERRSTHRKIKIGGVFLSVFKECADINPYTEKADDNHPRYNQIYKAFEWASRQEEFKRLLAESGVDGGLDR